MKFPRSACLLSLLLSQTPISGFGEEGGFAGALTPFFENHCYECHDDEVSKGGLDLFALNAELDDPASFAKWERIYDRVSKGEMPPPKKTKRPSEDDISAFQKILARPLVVAHERQKGTVLRRLNRNEYQNTLNDIFGTHIDLASLLPEDGRSHEFDNVGEALGISMVQLQRYLEAVETTLDVAIANTPDAPAVETLRADYAKTREGEQHIPKAWGKAPDGAVLFFRQIGYPSGMLRGSEVRKDGFYRVRVTGYAYQSDKPITFSVGGTSFLRGSEKPTYGFHEFKPGKPQTIEFTHFIKNRYMIDIKPWGLKDENNFIRASKSTEGYPGPGLAINGVEVEGPILDEFPSRGHRLIFEGVDRKVIPKNRRDYEVELQIEDPKAEAEKILTRVARVAFRRPVSEQQVSPYLDLFSKEFAVSGDFEPALRAAISGVFLSPDFLYLKEGPGFLDDYELACRLSYAFTRSTPDDSLLDLASQNKLASDPGELWKQTQRLIDSPEFDRFIIDFSDAWLNLRDIDFTTPDKDLFPEYDQYLQDSIIRETRMFLKKLITENHPVRSIVKSDFAMLNSRLAEHYGIPGVIGAEIREVKLPADSVRGGFLTQGSVLKVSANGTNTSPVMRGVWVMERILGQTPAPPPPGIPGVEPDIRGASTLRELLDKHRDSESCQACHQMIDPPGFALESFNPIGGWRDNFRSLGDGERVDLEVEGRRVRYKIGPPVDASGSLAGGEKFSGFSQFRDLLASQEDQLAKAFASKLLTFCSGREMGFSDRPRINQIVKESSAKGHGIRDLIRLVIFSDIFRKK